MSKAPPPPPPPTAPSPGKAAPAAKRTRKPLNLKPCEPKPIAPKLVLATVEGFGKTTALAYAPSPYIAMSPGETGYRTLLNAGRAPQIPAEEVEDWQHLLDIVDQLIEDPQGVKTFGIDTLCGMEKLMFEHVCQRDFNNDWNGKKDGFNSWGGTTGPRACGNDWRGLLSRLERLNATHGVSIFCLVHLVISKYSDPEAGEYKRREPDLDGKNMWPELRGWADAVLFGTYRTFIDNDGKGIAGRDRIIRTEHSAQADAKNRYGMPPEIKVDCDYAGVHDLIFTHITG